MRLAGTALRVAQALERNRHFGDEAIGHDIRRAVEEGVPGPVRGGNGRTAPAAAADVDDAVPLHVEGVQVEVVRPLLVEKGVEVDGDQIVLPRRVAVDPVGPHDARIAVVQVEPEVDVFAVVGHVDLGVLGRGGALERRLLRELGDRGRRPPGEVVEAAVDVRRRLRARGPHRGTAGHQPETGHRRRRPGQTIAGGRRRPGGGVRRRLLLRFRCADAGQEQDEDEARRQAPAGRGPAAARGPAAVHRHRGFSKTGTARPHGRTAFKQALPPAVTSTVPAGGTPCRGEGL